MLADYTKIIGIIFLAAMITTTGGKPAAMQNNLRVHRSLTISRAAKMLDANDLLVLRFDNSLIGENGEAPTQATGTSFQPGVNNQGVLLPNPNQLFYASANNINAIEGSFECWLKPTWNGNDGQGHFILQYGVGGGIVIGKDGANNMRIILNRFGVAPGGEVGVAVNIATWQANQWRHLAFTWSNSAKQLSVYIDGTLQQQTGFAINLPAISSSTFQIGGDGAGGYIQAIVDDLRISDRVRTAQEISDRMLAGLTVSSWSLNPTPPNIEMYPGWFYWAPLSVNAVTNIGNLSLPVLAASWTSSNPAVAVMDPSGRIKAVSPGAATLTGSLGGQQNNISVNVLAPALPPVEEPIEPFMATPASGYLYRMPVVIIRYFPTRDGVNLDSAAAGVTSTLAALKSNVQQIERRHKFMLEEGSRFRGYSNSSSAPSLGYQVIRTITVYEDIPPGFGTGTAGVYFPDYNQILTRFNAENLVNSLGVKEFWIVHYHNGRIAPNESNMSSPTTGDISNSYRTNGDQPIYNKTYVTYGINFTRSQAEATHNHGHQLEAIHSYVNQLRDGNTTLWWQLFAKPVTPGNNPPARCGNTHFPPNATQDYDYTNLNLVASDIINWQPSGGPTTMVNANTWGNIPYQWPGGTAPPQEVESKWYIFWFQSMAGRNNEIPYNANRLTNWWTFTGDWDAAIQSGMGLHEPGSCNYVLSATGQPVSDAGGAAGVNVISSNGCKWIASSNAPWIIVTGGRTGNGNGVVGLSVAANGTGNVRMGTVAVAGQVFTITQTATCPTITVNPETIPPSATGSPYSRIFSQSGGNGVTTFSLTGVLPTGMSFSGVELSGTPTQAGSFPITITATDANGCSGSRNYTLVVNCSFSIAPTSQNFIAAGANGSVNVTAGAGCNWMAQSNAAWISGVTSGGTGNGIVNFVIAANPGAQRAGTMTIAGYTFTATQDALGCPSITLAPSTLPNGFVGMGYHQTLSASGGTGAYSFNISSGALPTGLSLSSSGEVSGNPTTPGTFNFIMTATDANNCTGSRSYTVVVSGAGLAYYPLPHPIRLIDTRPGATACFTPNAPLQAGAPLTQQARINCDGVVIPAAAAAVVGNATVVNFLSGAGFITLYPNGAAQPTVSNLNYLSNQIVPNAFTVGLGASGEFNIFASSSTHFIVDITGYYAPPEPAGLYYHPLPKPIRLLDTRAGSTACDTPGAALTGGASRTEQARLTCDGVTIPAAAQAVVGNATVVNFLSGPGFITLFPSNATQPTVSNLNYLSNQIIPNSFTVGLGNDGAFKILASSTTEFIIDVAGYYSAEATDVNGTGLLYNALSTPIRLLDTRSGETACNTPGNPLQGGIAVTQNSRLTCSAITIPATAQAIVGNGTVVNFLSGPGFITLWPSGAAQPTVSNLNYLSNQIIPNAFTVALGNDGAFKIFASSTTNFIVDVAGYFAP